MIASEKALVRKRTRRLIRLWRDRLGLSRWCITANYVDGPVRVNGVLREDVEAACSSQWEYQTCEIDFSLSKCAALDDYLLEEVVIHELLHCFYGPFEGPPVLEEHMVTTLARSFQLLRDECERKAQRTTKEVTTA